MLRGVVVVSLLLVGAYAHAGEEVEIVNVADNSTVPQTRFLYLGGDALMKYVDGTDTFTVSQMERDALGKCNAFPKPATITGSLASLTSSQGSRNVLVYIGGRQMLRINDEEHRFYIYTCQTNGDALECEEAMNATTGAFQWGQLTAAAYVEPDKLVVYNRWNGDFAVHALHKSQNCLLSDDCGIQSAPLASGNLHNVCRAAPGQVHDGYATFSVTGTNMDQMFVLCSHKHAYVTVDIIPTSDTEQSHSLNVAKSGNIVHDDDVVGLGGDLVMGYTPVDEHYNIYDCTEGECIKVSNGSLAEEPPCMYSTHNTCIEDPRCGFCVETATCHEVGMHGPCYGACDNWVTNSTLAPVRPERSVAVPERQMVYLDERVVMHYVAASGTYKLYQVADNHPSHGGKCPALPYSPLYEGRVQYRYNSVHKFKDRSVIFVDHDTGAYAVWYCQPFSYEKHVGSAAPCSTIVTGIWPELIGDTNIMTIFNSSMVMHHDTGIVRIFKNNRDEDGSEDQFHSGIFSENITNEHHFPDMRGHQLITIGHNYIFEYRAQSGEYRVWVHDYATGAIHGPAGRGVFPVHESYHMSWMGDDRLLAITDTGEYLMMRFDVPATQGRVPVAFTSTGRGSFVSGTCQYATCGDCAADPACGWCETLNKCMPGNRIEACNDGSGDRCDNWMFDYCATQSCESRLYRNECIVDSECGWCESSGLCVERIGDVAKFGGCSGNLTIPN